MTDEEMDTARHTLISQVPMLLIQHISNGGRTYDTETLQEHFVVHSFMAPFAIVIEKSTKRIGSIMFLHHPRVYFDFQPASDESASNE